MPNKPHNNRLPRLAIKNKNWTIYRVAQLFTSKKGLNQLSNYPPKLALKLLGKFITLKSDENRIYKYWLIKKQQDLNLQNSLVGDSKSDKSLPKISILIDVHDSRSEFCVVCINYINWEIVISIPKIDFESSPIFKELEKYQDNRIIVLKQENKISNAESGNLLLASSTGDFILFIDQDDEISSVALHEMRKIIQQDKDTDFIYADEDWMDRNGNQFDPFFKPSWSPETLLARNYIGNPALIKKSLFTNEPLFRTDVDGALQFDMYLRITAIAKKIRHIPMVLYHNRIIEQKGQVYGTKLHPIDQTSAIKAIEDSLLKKGIKGTAKEKENSVGCFKVRFELKESKRVSIIIPTKDKADLCETLLTSIFKLTDYENFEIILVNNNSTQPEFFELVERWRSHESNRFKTITDNGDFNYSRLINNGAKASTGDYLLLLNNDMEVIHRDWMRGMIEYAQMSEIGAVGSILLFPNEKIQHAGVAIGFGGVASHIFSGYEKTSNIQFGILQSTNNFSAVTAACLMIRKAVFYEAGGFNEQLAVDYNDVDFCLTVLSLGYRNICLNHVQLYHYESISRGHPHRSKVSHKRHLRETAIVSEKWKKFIANDPYISPNFSKDKIDFKIKL